MFNYSIGKNHIMIIDCYSNKKIFYQMLWGYIIRSNYSGLLSSHLENIFKVPGHDYIKQ